MSCEYLNLQQHSGIVFAFQNEGKARNNQLSIYKIKIGSERYEKKSTYKKDCSERSCPEESQYSGHALLYINLKLCMSEN